MIEEGKKSRGWSPRGLLSIAPVDLFSGRTSTDARVSVRGSVVTQEAVGGLYEQHFVDETFRLAGVFHPMATAQAFLESAGFPQSLVRTHRVSAFRYMRVNEGSTDFRASFRPAGGGHRSKASKKL
jgi:hypothetical protein